MRRKTIRLKSENPDRALGKHNAVEEFLATLHTSDNVDEVFTKESYWFAVILFRKFIRDGARIVVDEYTGHVGTRIHGRVYDITGDVTDKYCSWNERT